MTDKPTVALARYDKTHVSLTDGLTVLQERAKSLDLEAPDAEFAVTRLAATARSALEVAKDRRDRESAPHAEALAEVKMRWRSLVDGFDALVRDMKAAVEVILKKRREDQERTRQEAEARLAAARDAERVAAESMKSAALKDLRTARAAVDALPPAGAPIGIKTDKGSLSERKTWTWEVEKLELVPEAYITRYVDPTKVDLAVKNGVRAIPGIRIYERVDIVGGRSRKK